ncbi:MAG: Rpn family recombination-promoting nuclease/putative transposase [Clostridium sp.]
MSKKLQELDLKDDFLFAKVMSDKEVCKELLEKLLEIKICKIEMPENQKTIDLLLESKGIRLDVYVQDENNTVYNIEMQRGDKKNLPKRLRYYQGNIDLDLIQKGEYYMKLAKSYIIFICTFDLFSKGRHKYTFETVCTEDNSIKLNDDAQKIILNTTGIMKDLSDELIEFLKYVEHSDDKTASEAKGELVKKIHKRVVDVKNDVSVEVEFMTLLERDREKIEEGKLEGKLEGISLAKKVFKLLNKGESISTIAKICEISEDEVREILE